MGCTAGDPRSSVGQVIFLGTGDPLNEERAQTCLAVPLAADETMLIDVSGGIDVLRQLTAAGIPLEKVRHLFVTHRHFDHAGGLAPFLVALTPLSHASLTVHALPETLRALRELLVSTIPGVEDWMGERLRWEGLTPGQPVRAGERCLVLPHIRASRFADPVALAKEAEAAFGRPVGVAWDLDAFDF